MKKWIEYSYFMVCIILIIAFILLSFKQERYRSSHYLYQAGLEVQNNIVTLLDTLEDNLGILNTQIKALENCEQITPYLQRYAFEHPGLSAISIVKNDLRCASTDHTALHALPTGDRILSGPLSDSTLKDTFYIVQYRLNHQRFYLFLLASVLQNTLRSTNPVLGQVEIYDNTSNQVLSTYESSQFKQSIVNHPSWLQHITLPIGSQKHIVLRISNEPGTVWASFWKFELLEWGLLLLLLYCVFLLLRRTLDHRFSLKRELQVALRSNQFLPYYQPLYNWQEQRFTAVEVLMRWRDSNNTLIMPDSFIAEAERSGLILPMTQMIIQRALIELKDWLEYDSAHHVAFNITTAHLNDTALLDSLTKTCHETPIKPHQIVLELTERDFISTSDSHMYTQLHLIRKAGFKIAIDDFGTGHSSIQYLNTIPLDYLKIDKMYTDAIGTDSVTALLLEPILLLAKNLTLTVIAEGVESKEQEHSLIEQKVSLLQGWLYAKAMPIKEFLVLALAKR